MVAENESRRAFFRVPPAPPDEDDSAQEREIGCGVPGPSARLVLEPGGIAGVVVFVFDAPPGTDHAQGIIGGEWFAEDKDPSAGAGLCRGFVGAVAFNFEELRRVDEAELFWGNGEGAKVALVDAAVP